MVRNMRRDKTLFVLLIVACSLAWQISVVSSEQYTPILMVSANDLYLTAGEENQIEIKLRNMGDFDVFEVKAILSIPATTQGISILSGAHKVLNEIEEGETKTYHPVLYVDRKTPLGAYSLTLQVNYRKMFQAGEALPESTTVQIGIVVENVTKTQTGLNIKMERLNLKTGTEEEAIIKIDNIGEETVYDVEATITSISPYIAVIDIATYKHDTLESGESASFTSTIAISRNAPLGVYTLAASVSYEDGDGREYLETFTLGLTIDSIQVAEQTSVVLRRYATNPEAISPGDVVDLSVELTCLGARAYDVKAMLHLDPLTGISTLSPTLIALGNLEPGKLTEASYRLLVDGGLKAGQYSATLSLSYIDVDGVPRSLVETMTLRIRAIVEFRLINMEPIIAERGGVTEFEVDLLLIGTESVKFVTIEVVEDMLFRRTSDSVEYMGAVDPDSPIPFDLEFEVVEGTETGDYSLTLKVAYTDDLNQEHEEYIVLEVTVIEASAELETSSDSGGGFWLWLRRLFGILP